MSEEQRILLHDHLERIERIQRIAVEGETLFRASFVH